VTLASIVRDHAETLAILVPIAVAIIGSVAGPLWLARRKDKIEQSVSILEEGRELRRDLAERVDKLEARLEEAGASLNEALDTIRELRSELDRERARADALERECQFLRETS